MFSKQLFGIYITNIEYRYKRYKKTAIFSTLILRLNFQTVLPQVDVKKTLDSQEANNEQRRKVLRKKFVAFKQNQAYKKQTK